MKRLFTAVLAFSVALSLRAQAPAGGTSYGPEQLDQLLGPIALYPDPLVALILPASTFPDQVSAAAAFVSGSADPSTLDSQPWDASVKGLAHYPDVLKWMNDNIDWTRSVGAAFAMQPADVMKSVQQLRAKARAAGTLTNTPQQQVDMQGDDIRIVPTQPDTIYVPEYDADDVFDIPEGYAGPFITFGIGYPVGPWLGYECNWDNFGIWVGPWHPGWGYRRDWNDGRRFHPDARVGHALVRNFYRPGGNLPSPRLIAGARGSAGPTRGQSAGFRSAPAPEREDFRGYGGGAMARPSSPAPEVRGSLFGGYNRGTQVRDYSDRGHSSRQSPVRSAPSSGRSSAAPSRGAEPSGGGGHERR
jgi:hypothetical protein